MEILWEGPSYVLFCWVTRRGAMGFVCVNEWLNLRFVILWETVNGYHKLLILSDKVPYLHIHDINLCYFVVYIFPTAMSVNCDLGCTRKMMVHETD